MDGLVFRLLDHGTPEYDELVRLRSEVLRTPLGLKFSQDELDREKNQIHIAAYENEKLIGCLILAPLDATTVKMRQVAIAPGHQSRGIGRRLVKHAEQLAEQKGFGEIVLNARESAVRFYLALEYMVYGEPFTEVTLPHRNLRKRF